MLNVEKVHAFLSLIVLQELMLFVGVLLALMVLTSLIRITARTITQLFPKRRMTIFNWIPFLNFIIYGLGFFGSFYLIFQPSKEIYIGLIASALVAFGFTAKEILSSIIAGIVLLIDKPFQVGDRVTFQDVYGEILSIGLRSVRLFTLDENVVTIPNHRFMSDIVSTSNAGELGMMVTVDTYIAPAADLSAVKGILEKIAYKNIHVDTQKPVVIVARELLNMTGVVSIAMKTKCSIKDMRTEKEFQTSFIIEVNRELKHHGSMV